MNLFKTLVPAVIIALSGAAWAHGDADAGKKPNPVRKEQKAWGIAGEARAAKRSIEVRMTDTMRFIPDALSVRRGETVRLVIRNDGRMLHEFVLGTKKDLDEHAALMIKFPTMEHDEPYMAHVAPGNTAQIVWHFNRAGQFDFACLIAGHYQAGMVGKVTVSAK